MVFALFIIGECGGLCKQHRKERRSSSWGKQVRRDRIRMKREGREEGEGDGSERFNDSQRQFDHYLDVGRDE